MKTLYSTCILLILTIALTAQTPNLSPSSEITQTVGLTDVTVNYSRPSMKGRSIFGGILPYNEFWRVGANNATKISLKGDLTIATQVFKKGDYAVLAKPEKNQWSLFFYPYESTNWGSYREQTPYKTLTIKTQSIQESVETLEFSFKNLSMGACDLVLVWENTKIVLALKTDINAQVLKNIEKMEAGPGMFQYFFAAVFLHEQNLDLNKALRFVNNAIDVKNPDFFMVHRKAAILKDLNKNTEALQVAKLALELSKKAENNDFIRLSNELIAELK